MGTLEGWIIERIFITDEDGNILGEVEPYALETINDEEVCKNNKDDKQEEI